MWAIVEDNLDNVLTITDQIRSGIEVAIFAKYKQRPTDNAATRLCHSICAV